MNEQEFKTLWSAKYKYYDKSYYKLYLYLGPNFDLPANYKFGDFINLHHSLHMPYSKYPVRLTKRIITQIAIVIGVSFKQWDYLFEKIRKKEQRLLLKNDHSTTKY